MKTIEIELLLILLFLVCLGAYYVGKVKKIDLLKCIGKSGSVVSLVLVVSNAVLLYLRR